MGNALKSQAAYKPPDPRTSMVHAELIAVNATWKAFQERDGGSGIFVELFRRYPEYKLIFPDFAHKSSWSWPLIRVLLPTVLRSSIKYRPSWTRSITATC